VPPDAAHPLPWSPASAVEVAGAAGAADLFVFRRVADGHFAHVGGVGRGAGWAGIVEVGLENEPIVASAVAESSVVTRVEAEPWRVLGPYYTRSAAIVPVNDDVFVVFGSLADDVLAASDDELLELARFACDALIEVEPAKRLADEIETLNAVRELLQAPAGSFDEALQRLVDQATSALSCDLGLAYVPGRRGLAVCELAEGRSLSIGDARTALEELPKREFPLCVQEAQADELPAPFRSSDGVLAYYLLELKQPLPGLLLLLHTRAGVARGFTLLCQQLGAKLVDAAEPLLSAALLRDTLQEELERASDQARREPLTGVGNRLAWDEALAAAQPTQLSPVTIVKVDCRGLKVVNDTYGHHIGDQLLKQVAAVLDSSSRDGDLVARLGGDEFGMLLLGADGDVARGIVERVESTLAAARVGGEARVGLAIGIATAYDDLEAASEQADLQLLDAKRRS
jgi:diguanylate cyclase (GGDEF)-like protein